MKLDMYATFHSRPVGGETLFIGDKPLTMKDVLVQALLANIQGDTADGNEKLVRYKLSVRIDNGETEFTIEEVSKMKHLVGLTFTALIVGQAYAHIEGN